MRTHSDSTRADRETTAPFSSLLSAFSLQRFSPRPRIERRRRMKGVVQTDWHEVMARVDLRRFGNVIARAERPLIRLRHLLPHRKDVGEKALDWKVLTTSRSRHSTAPLLSSLSAFSPQRFSPRPRIECLLPTASATQSFRGTVECAKTCHWRSVDGLE